MRGFAEALEGFAVENGVRELVDYTRDLLTAVSNFDLDRVNALLAQFPPLPYSLDEA